MFTKNTLGSVLWFSILGFVRPAVKIFLLPLYLVYLTPEDYGILALVTIFSSIMVIFSNFKLDAALRVIYFDYKSDSKELWNYIAQIFTTSVIMGIIVMTIMALFGPILMKLSFTSDEVTYYPYGLIALASAVFSTFITVYYIYLKNEVRMREYFIYSISFLILSIGMQFYLVVFEQMGVLGVLYGGFFANLLLFLIISLKNPRLYTYKLKLSTILPSFKFALPLIPFTLFYKFENQLDRLVLERYMSLETVGLYALLVALVGLLTILLVALENGVRPFLYRKLKLGGKEAEKWISTYFDLFILSGLIALSGILMVGSNLDLLTQNTKYLSIREFFVLATLAAIPMIFLRYFSTVLLYYKRTKELTIVTLVKTVVMFALMLYLIPLYGIPGALIAVSISYIFNAVIFYVLLQKFGAPHIRITKALKAISILFVCVFTCKYLIIDMFLMGILQFIFFSAFILPLIVPILRKVAKQKLITTT